MATRLACIGAAIRGLNLVDRNGLNDGTIVVVATDWETERYPGKWSWYVSRLEHCTALQRTTAGQLLG